MFIWNLLFKLCSGKWGLIASSSHVKSVFGSINLKLKRTDTHTEEHHYVAPWCSSVMYDCSLYTDYHVFKEVVTCEREVEMDRVLFSASSAGVLTTLCSQQWPKPETRAQRRTEISPEREASANALFESSNRPSSSLKHELSRCEEDSCVFLRRYAGLGANPGRTSVGATWPKTAVIQRFDTDAMTENSHLESQTVFWGFKTADTAS